MTGRSIADAVRDVVGNDNCSGCGACAALSAGVRMQYDPAGFLRPVCGSEAGRVAPDMVRQFDRVCPGVSVRAARPPGATVHPIFGPYLGVWSARATDRDVRLKGSSAGVLSALSIWLLATNQADSVVGAGPAEDPRRTVALELRTRAEVLGSAGSRYAPVGNAALVGPSTQAFVGKPCEISAARELRRGTSNNPVFLSFFCAGVPSQAATDSLIKELGVDPERLIELRYRGDGWPGRFVAVDELGHRGTLSYEASWGEHLGRQVQDRCKICPDGTGEHADVAVGDYWDADDEGYPRFVEGVGESVLLARTPRGLDLIREAERAGVIELTPVGLDSVSIVQPLQVNRRMTLFARLVGRRLAGRPVPRFHGFGLWRWAAGRPVSSVRVAKGSWLRARTKS